MKYLIIIVVACAGLFSSIAWGTTALPIDKIIAVVNDSVITESEFNAAVRNLKKQLASTNTSAPAKEELQTKVLDQLIDHKLQLQLADQAGLKITDDKVDQAIASIADQNKITVDQLLSQVAKTGLTKNAYRKEIKEEIAIQSIAQQEVGAKIAITPQEINEYMQTPIWHAFNKTEYRLEDLIVALPNTPTSKDVSAARKTAESLIARINPGVGLAQVEMAESANNQNVQAGDLGWLRLPQVPPAFADQLVNAKKNALLGPIPTQNGFHILRVVDKRQVAVQGDKLAQQKQVQQMIYQRKMEEGVQSWLSKIRSEAFINRHPEV